MSITETAPMSQTPADTGDIRPAGDQYPVAFGPTPEDLDSYQTLLNRIRDHGADSLVWNPRANAEQVSQRIDQRAGGVFLSECTYSSEADVPETTRLKLGQQRYVAAALGLRVGPTVFHFDSQTARFDIALPDAADIPPRPTRNATGEFLDAKGTQIGSVQVDAIHAAHWLSTHPKHFSKPGAFEELFRAVVAQAEKGEFTFQAQKGQVPKDYMSLTRQIARVLGYEVGKFSKGTQPDTFTMPIQGKQSGFDSQYTHFL